MVMVVVPEEVPLGLVEPVLADILGPAAIVLVVALTLVVVDRAGLVEPADIGVLVGELVFMARVPLVGVFVVIGFLELLAPVDLVRSMAVVEHMQT